MRTVPVQEMEADLGESLRAMRLNQNVSQAELAFRAGISIQTLRNVEGGHGSSLYSFLAVLRGLGRENWIKTLTPQKVINPLSIPVSGSERQRAKKKPS